MITCRNCTRYAARLGKWIGPEARKVCKHWREACGVRGVEDKVTTDPYPVAASVPRRRRVLEAFAEKSEAGAKLLDRLLALSPLKKRVTAKDALDDDFFWGGAPPLSAGTVAALGLRSVQRVARRHARRSS